MWESFFAAFAASLIGAGALMAVTGRFRAAARRPRSTAALTALMVALAISAPWIAFGCFPLLREGKIRFAVAAAVALSVCLPFSFLIRRLDRKAAAREKADG